MRGVLIVVFTLTALLVATALDDTPAAAGKPRASRSIGALRICSVCRARPGELARYGYVILNSRDAPLIPRLKRENPGLKALVYKNLTFSFEEGCPNGADRRRLSTGVGWCDANSHHPDWFLTAPTGARLASARFPWSWMMDVGNPGYEQRWLDNVATDLSASGWDGVFADDTNADMSWHLEGRTIARYGSPRAWQAATRRMLARVGPTLRKRGFLFVPNIADPWSGAYDARALWRDWLRFTSGAAQEHFTKSGTGSDGWFTGAEWAFQQQFQRLTERAGKIFLGITYSPPWDARSMVYARATFLLNRSSDRSALVYSFGDRTARDPYAAPWTVDVGKPVEPRRRVGRAWRRAFTGGVVAVNPSTSSVRVPLGRRYLDVRSRLVSSIRLAPATGAILRSRPRPSPSR